MRIMDRILILSLFALAFAASTARAQTGGVADLAKLKDKRDTVRTVAVKSLGRSGDERAIEPLIEVMNNDDDLFVRAEAALALGNFRNKRAVEALIATYGVAAGNVTEAASRSLKHIGGVAIPLMIEALARADSSATRDLIDAFEIIGEPSVDPLIAALRKPETQLDATEALGRIKNARAVPPLIELLKDSSPAVRSTAASALGNIADVRATGALRPLLKDSDGTVRAAAAYALGELKDAESVDEIAAMMSENDNDLKRDVGTALSNINTPRAIEHLLSAARKQDLAVVAGGYKTYLRRLTPALTTTLVKTLQEFGDQEMVQAFLNSGNRRLASEARAWAKENGYEIFSIPTYGTGKRRRRG